MKRWKISFFPLLLMVSLTVYCTPPYGENIEIINLSPSEAISSIQLSDLVDTLEYIPLETVAESIMISVKEIKVKEKYIYAVDNSQSAVFLFDNKGKFVSKLDKRGEGPDQYQFLGPVFVDDTEQFLDIIDNKGYKSRKLRYSIPNFDFVDSWEFEAPLANSWIKNGDYIYFSTQQLENSVKEKISNADIIVVHNDRITKSLFEKNIQTGGTTYSPNSESFTSNQHGEVFVSLMFDNTFYQLEENKAIPILSIDFGKYGIDHSYKYKSVEEQMKYLNNETDGLASFPVLNVNNDYLLSFTYYFKVGKRNQIQHYLKFKDSGKVVHVRDIQNNLSNFPEKIYLSSYFFAINHQVMKGSYFYDVVLPWQALGDKSQIEIPGIGIIDAEDNPVIVKMKVSDKN